MTTKNAPAMRDEDLLAEVERHLNQKRFPLEQVIAAGLICWFLLWLSAYPSLLP